MSDERCLNDFVGNPIIEKRFCEARGIPTESDKVARATIEAACFQKKSFLRSRGCRPHRRAVARNGGRRPY
jgi:hypothetical protein